MYVVECVIGGCFQGYIASHNTRNLSLVNDEIDPTSGLGARRFSTIADALAWIESQESDGCWPGSSLRVFDLDYSPPDEPVRPPVAEGG